MINTRQYDNTIQKECQNLYYGTTQCQGFSYKTQSYKAINDFLELIKYMNIEE